MSLFHCGLQGIYFFFSRIAEEYERNLEDENLKCDGDIPSPPQKKQKVTESAGAAEEHEIIHLSSEEQVFDLKKALGKNIREENVTAIIFRLQELQKMSLNEEVIRLMQLGKIAAYLCGHSDKKVRETAEETKDYLMRVVMKERFLSKKKK